MRLTEKYRPRQLSEIVGQDKAVKVLTRYEGRHGGRAYYISGKSGTGKTSLARIIAAEVADPLNTRELVGRLLTTSILREIMDNWAYYPMGDKPGYALIVNESHGLSKPVIEMFLDVLESLKSNVVVIFTTTNEGLELFEDAKLDAGAFASRCICIRLTNQGVTKPFAQRIREIAQAEGLDGQPEAAYIRLVSDCKQNFRECLTLIESGAMCTE